IRKGALRGLLSTSRYSATSLFATEGLGLPLYPAIVIIKSIRNYPKRVQHMKRHTWARFLLWTHVIGVIGFYITLWLRTKPHHEILRVCARSKASSAVLTQPLVSIIVPARNEERNIRRCVTSLLEQDYENYEVIVVED